MKSSAFSGNNILAGSGALHASVIDKVRPQSRILSFKRSVLISERMIEEIPEGILADYVWIRLKVGNGVLFGGHETYIKLGWSESKFWKSIAAMKHWGLIRKDDHGHYVLTERFDAVQAFALKKKGGGPTTHKTTLKLRTDFTRKKVKDWISFKLAERRAAQFARAGKRVLEFKKGSHLTRSGIMRSKGFKAGHIWEVPADHPAPPQMLELESGFVSMTVKELAKSMGKSERWVYRWKKRNKRLFVQRNREVLLSAELSMALDTASPKELSRLRFRWKCALIRGWKGWKMILPNAYRLIPKYCGPKKKGMTNAQLAIKYLKNVEGMMMLLKSKQQDEAEWMQKALCDPYQYCCN